MRLYFAPNSISGCVTTFSSIRTPFAPAVAPSLRTTAGRACKHSRAPALVTQDNSASHVKNTSRPELSSEVIVFSCKNLAGRTLGRMPSLVLQIARYFRRFSNGSHKTYYLMLSVFFRIG
ncbi:MAG TPA: hypothetical protein VKJ77_15085, partial [Caballeronia sp.]|nr:hypothetical protein [Caballeronia sp.]